MGQTTPALYIPMWIPYAAVPLGMFLVALRAFQAYRETVREIRSAAPSEVK
jgi:TRAP-type C4-dicarboxylate transport system permease small subunit